jgi:hypothetical protein
MDLLNEINGIVERNQWNGSSILAKQASRFGAFSL